MLINSGDALVESIVDRFIWLRPVYREHLKDNHGELLPHVIFWDITQAVISSYLGREPHLDWLGLVRMLEVEYQRGDPYVRGIIDVSFLESMPPPGKEGYGIVEMLPSALRAAFNQIRPTG